MPVGPNGEALPYPEDMMGGGMDAGMGLNGAPAEGGSAPGIDADEQAVIDALTELMKKSTDSADSAAFADIIAKLTKLLAANEDAALSAGGGNPKQLRAMGKAYSGGSAQ